MVAHECRKDEIINDIKKDIENLYAVKDIVIELKTLTTMQIEQNKRQDDMLRQQSETMIKITDTLTQQGDLIKKCIDKQQQTDDTICEQNLKNIKDSSVSFNEIIKEGLFKYVPPLIIAGIMYYILDLTSKG